MVAQRLSALHIMTPQGTPQGKEMLRLEELRPWAEALWDALASELRSSGFEDVRSRLAPTRQGLRPADDELLLGWAPFEGLDAEGRPTSPRLRVLGTPCYQAPGVSGPLGVFHVLVRSDLSVFELEDLRGRRFAAPEALALPAMRPVRELFAPHSDRSRFFSRTFVCPGPLAALERLTEGTADATAIDAVTHELVRRERPELLARTRQIAETRFAPLPPLVTASRLDVEQRRRILAALRRVLGDPRLAAARKALLLSGVASPLPGGLCEDRSVSVPQL